MSYTPPRFIALNNADGSLAYVQPDDVKAITVTEYGATEVLLYGPSSTVIMVSDSPTEVAEKVCDALTEPAYLTGAAFYGRS